MMMQRVPALLIYKKEYEDAPSNQVVKKKQVLLVGEGNFSFGASISKNWDYHIVATCWQNPATEFDEFTQQNMKLIHGYGGETYLDVNAVTMESHPVIGKRVFDRVVFNFPHISGKMNILRNRTLLCDFFKSASKLLSEDGEVHVSLLYGQSGTGADNSSRAYNDSWQIVTNAAKSDLFLHSCQPFFASDYEHYKPTGYRGGRKAFRLHGAFTYIFCIGIQIERPILQLDDQLRNDIDWLNIIDRCFEKNIEDIEGIMIQDVENPIHVLFSDLKTHMTLDYKGDLLRCIYIHKEFDSQFENLYNKHAMFCKTSDASSSFFETHQVVATSLFNMKLKPKAPDAFHHFAIAVLPNLTGSMNVFWKPYLLMCAGSRSSLIVKLDRALVPLLEGCGSVIKVIDETITVNQVRKVSDSRFPVVALVATFEEKNICGHRIYSNLQFFVRRMKGVMNTGDQSLVCGVFGEIQTKERTYAFLSLDGASLAMIKHNVFDERVLYSVLSCSTEFTCEEIVSEVYRPICLHVTKYELHSSFWVKKDFTETVLLLFVATHMDEMIEKVDLLEVYNDGERKSLCFRFIYSAIDKPMSREKAVYIHNTYTVVLLCNVFHMELR